MHCEDPTQSKQAMNAKATTPFLLWPQSSAIWLWEEHASQIEFTCSKYMMYLRVLHPHQVSMLPTFSTITKSHPSRHHSIKPDPSMEEIQKKRQLISMA